MNEFWHAVAFGAGAAAAYKLCNEAFDAFYAFTVPIVLRLVKGRGMALRMNGVVIDTIDDARRVATGGPIHLRARPMPMPMAYAALPRVPGPWVFSREWTTEDRLRLTQLLAAVIRDDLGQGRYSQPGRPNLTSILEMVDASPLVLEEHRESIETIARE